MKQKRHYKPVKKSKNNYHRVAAAFAGAALVSAAMLNPGIAAAATPQAPAKAPAASHQQAPEKSGMAKHVKVGHKKDIDRAAAKAKQEKQNKQTMQTKQAKPAEKSQKAESNKDVLHVTATAYAPGAHDNDQWGNKTYLGTNIRPGVIAVDPNVIPLGSTVKIELPNGETMHAVAEDTGGAIKGNRIDIAKWSVPEAEQFGMKDVKVTILQKGEKS